MLCKINSDCVYKVDKLVLGHNRVEMQLTVDDLWYVCANKSL